MVVIVVMVIRLVLAGFVGIDVHTLVKQILQPHAVAF
jgi:hypothetical protein